MEKVLVDELVKEVRVTLDENQVESEYLQSSTENMELNEIIRSKMPDAVRGIVEMCPVSLLNADALRWRMMTGRRMRTGLVLSCCPMISCGWSASSWLRGIVP